MSDPTTTLRTDLVELARIMEILGTKSVSETVSEVEWLARLKREYAEQSKKAADLFYVHVDTVRDVLATLPPVPDPDRTASLDAMLGMMNEYSRLSAAYVLLASKKPAREFTDYDRALMFLLADVLPERLGGEIHQEHVDRLRSIGETIAADLAHAAP